MQKKLENSGFFMLISLKLSPAQRNIKNNTNFIWEFPILYKKRSDYNIRNG